MAAFDKRVVDFKVRLREPGLELEASVEAVSHGEAAEMAMTDWIASGKVGVDQLPMQAIVTTKEKEPHAWRFQFDPPPAFSIDDMHACQECGCTDDDACDPPCSWVTDDVCSNPACVKAAGGGS